MAGSFSGDVRGMANFSSGNRFEVCPKPSLGNAGGGLLPVDCTGDVSVFRLGVAVGVISDHVTNGRVSY